jgi:hypothetical protein
LRGDFFLWTVEILLWLFYVFCNYRDVIYVNVCHNSVKSRYGRPKIQIIIGSMSIDKS